MAATMTRFLHPACLSVFYINPTLTLKSPFPTSPSRISISATNSVTDPPPLLSPPSASVSRFFMKLMQENVALNCFLRFPDSYATGSHKNLSVLEIALSVVLTIVEDAAR
ncbi:hypothetical protein Tsp_09619 [Trichinella spiralis]|uniref:hypothetical protein n=1 Tax=Trichinella spiralis TaxID=6334 RepID=UPI0001EFF037|nr:hypothetical protein Tsp_09619 [Trichinella spiralis]